MMPLRLLFALLLVGFILPGNSSAQDGTTVMGAGLKSVPELEAGFRFLYEQKFPEARENFIAWGKEHPDEPFGHIALAASYLFEEFYKQGVLSSEFFLDDKRFLHGISGKPDAQRMAGFHKEHDLAIEAAQQRLKKDPKDADALFALTLAAGMQADALSILEKKNLDSLKQIKLADADGKRLLVVRPDAADAWVALGAANYIIGSTGSATRFVLWFGGVHGDRALGMEQLRKCAEGGHYLRPFGKILLALAARREKQNDRARELLRQLKVEFPESPLFALEYARAQDKISPSPITR
jgi:hypothetical protein